jgi:hypothetical protein
MRGIAEVAMSTLSLRSLRILACSALVASILLVLGFDDANQAPVGAAALGPYGGCAAPASAGIAVCEPGEPNSFAWETDSPFQVIASATSGTGQVETMELWADGKKVAQASGSPFNEPVSLGVGTHSLTVIDTTGDVLKSSVFPVAVQSVADDSCAMPGNPGVHVCEPQSNGCNTQPWVDISAAGKGASGKVARMELWINGNKVANFPGDRIQTSLIMVDGAVKIDEVDSKGATLGSTFFFSGPC